MRLGQVVSHSPHNCINLNKISNDYMNAYNTPRIMLHYLSDTQFHMDDIDDICDDIRDKDYQVEVKYNAYNIGDRDIPKLVKEYGLENYYQVREYELTHNQFMDMKMMGLDPYSNNKTKHWIHEKSFIKEVISIEVTNKHIQTSIEKEYADGKVLERTLYPEYYKMVTEEKVVHQPVVYDDIMEECVERIGYILGTEGVVREGYFFNIEYVLFKEIV